MTNIHLFKDFVSSDEAKQIIDFIDINLNKFVYNEERLRYMLRFGYDEELPEQAIHTMEIVENIKPNLIDIFKRTQSVLGKDQVLTSWFLSKQVPGAKLLPHKDGVEGCNSHLDYTAMLYLNSLDDNGIIQFPDLGMSFLPECGDLIIFKSLEHKHAVTEITQDRYALPMWFTHKKMFEFKID